MIWQENYIYDRVKSVKEKYDWKTRAEAGLIR